MNKLFSYMNIRLNTFCGLKICYVILKNVAIDSF